jgi:hypothetical protein
MTTIRAPRMCRIVHQPRALYGAAHASWWSAHASGQACCRARREHHHAPSSRHTCTCVSVRTAAPARPQNAWHPGPPLSRLGPRPLNVCRTRSFAIPAPLSPVPPLGINPTLQQRHPGAARALRASGNRPGPRGNRLHARRLCPWVPDIRRANSGMTTAPTPAPPSPGPATARLPPALSSGRRGRVSPASCPAPRRRCRRPWR